MPLGEAFREGFKAFFGGLSKKEELLFPYEWALVRRSKISKMNGIDDEFNKEIVIIKNNKESKIYAYSESMIEILRDQEIPVEFEPEDYDEDIEFEDISSPGQVVSEK